MVTTITGKNQITLPAEIVKELGLIPGTRLDWSIGPNGTLVGRKKLSRAELARNLRGAGRRYLKSGVNPVDELLQERELDAGE